MGTDHCPGFIAEAPRYSWDSKAALLSKDEPVKVNDHSLDGGRYAIATTENMWRSIAQLARRAPRSLEVAVNSALVADEVDLRGRDRVSRGVAFVEALEPSDCASESHVGPVGKVRAGCSPPLDQKLTSALHHARVGTR